MDAVRSLTAFLDHASSVEEELRSAYAFFDDFTSDSDLLPWSEVNSFIGNHWHDDELVRMSRGHDPVAKSRYVENNQWRGRLRLDKFYEEIGRGASVVLENAGGGIELISMLEQVYERKLRDEVASQVFVATSDTKGFGAHWDGYDVFVTQLNGSRRWSIYGMTKPAPLLEDYDFPEAPEHLPLAEYELRPGNVLYLKRGCWHDVHAPTSSSAHVTIAVSRRTGLDFLTWVNDELRASDIARSDVPRDVDASTLRRYLDGLKGEIERLLTEEALARYLEQENAFSPAHPIFSVPVEIESLERIGIRSLLPRAQIKATSHGAIVTADGREILINDSHDSVDLVPLLGYLLHEPRVRSQSLRKYFTGSDEVIIAFLGDLVRLGVVAVDR